MRGLFKLIVVVVGLTSSGSLSAKTQAPGFFSERAFLFTRTPKGDIRGFRLLMSQAERTVELQPIQFELEQKYLEVIRLNWVILQRAKDSPIRLPYQTASLLEEDEMKMRKNFQPLYQATIMEKEASGSIADGKSPQAFYKDREDQYIQSYRKQLQAANEYQTEKVEHLILTKISNTSGGIFATRSTVPSWASLTVTRHLTMILDQNRLLSAAEKEKTSQRIRGIEKILKKSRDQEVLSRYRYQLVLEMEALKDRLRLGRMESMTIAASSQVQK